MGTENAYLLEIVFLSGEDVDMKVGKKLFFDLLGIIGSILLIVGSCLAWAIVPNLPSPDLNTLYGYSLAEGAMLLILGFLGFIASIIMAAYPEKIMTILVVVIGLVSLLTCIYDIVSLSVIVYGPYPSVSASEYPVDVGIGLYLSTIGSILILVAGLLFLFKAIKKKK